MAHAPWQLFHTPKIPNNPKQCYPNSFFFPITVPLESSSFQVIQQVQENLQKEEEEDEMGSFKDLFHAMSLFETALKGFDDEGSFETV